MKTVQFKKISGTMPMLILFAGKNLQETYFKWFLFQTPATKTNLY